MSIVSTTLCYPNPAARTQGLFVQRRLRAIHRIVPVRVVAPVPWFPILKPAPPPLDPIPITSEPRASARAEPRMVSDPDRFLAPPRKSRRGETWVSESGGEDDPQVWVPPVCHPKMFYLPGFLKRCDARFYAAAFGRALSAARAGAVSLIDAHFVWPDGVGAWRVAVERALPFVCTIRGKLVSQIAEPAKRRQIVAMLRGADALIAVSQSLADLAREVAGGGMEVRVIPNGVDRTVFRPCGGGRVAARRALGWSDAAKYVVSVGHLQALKRFDRLVCVWPEVCRRGGDVRLVLVGGEAGEPGYARRLRAQVEKVNAEVARRVCGRAVTLAGRQSPKAVAGMLSAADLFVLASRSEGWCNAIAEALACGCPVVASNVGGNREIVSDSGLGALVPGDDDDDVLIGVICGALDRPWDRKQIAERGRQRDWSQVARECVDVFETVLRRRS